MSTHASKSKQCPECRRSVDPTTMRPLSRSRYGGGLRYACPDCYTRVRALRRVAREARSVS